MIKQHKQNVKIPYVDGGSTIVHCNNYHIAKVRPSLWLNKTLYIKITNSHKGIIFIIEGAPPIIFNPDSSFACFTLYDS